MLPSPCVAATVLGIFILQFRHVLRCPAPSPSPAAEHTQVHGQLLPDGFKLRSTVTLDDQTNTKTSTLVAKWTGLGREGRQLRERPLQMSVREESYRGFEQQ